MSNAIVAYQPKPIWDGSSTPQQPKLINNRGYDVIAGRHTQDQRNNIRQSANATLNDNSFQWPLFVHDLSIDIGLSGQTAQARKTRDFYPHNFVQPSFTVQGQALDQQDYGYLCDFIHQAQKNSVSGGAPLLQFWLDGKGSSYHYGSGLRVQMDSGRFANLNATESNQKMRGRHLTVCCQGYIGSMPRQHTVGQGAPTYSFEFVVAEMIKGPWQESMGQQAEQATWIDLLQATSDLKVDHNLKWNNTWILNWVKKNQFNIYNTSAT